MNKPKLIISDMYRAKNKISFFAIHQALTKFHMFDIEFHILWDDIEYIDEWSKKIDTLDCKIISYTKSMLDQYCLDCTPLTVTKLVTPTAAFLSAPALLLENGEDIGTEDNDIIIQES